MKKNIQINIFGTIYAIDEDAYKLLENYLEGMKNYFSRQDDGNEIADDIEHRVAELLWECKEQGMEAVNIETVKEIIEKIGNPAEIADEAQSHDSSSDETQNEASGSTTDNGGHSTSDGISGFFERIGNHMRQRRLYRNTSDKMLGGVCSGLAEYVGWGDVTLWRFATVILTLIMATSHWWLFRGVMHSIIPLLYIIMWIVVPEAKGPEDRLRMKGRTVTPENLKEQIVSDSTQAHEETKKNNSSNGSGCLKVILSIILILIMLPLMGIFFAIAACIISMIGLTLNVVGVSGTLFPGTEWVRDLIMLNEPLAWATLISALIAVGMPIYAISRFIGNKKSSLSTTTITSMILAWIIALAVAIFGSVGISADVMKKVDEQQKIECTRNGVTLNSSHEWDKIDRLGWTVKKLENINGHLVYDNHTRHGLSSDRIVIDRKNSTKPASLLMECKDYLDKGRYTIDMIASCNGNGLYVKAMQDSIPEPLTTLHLASAGQLLKDMPWNTAKNIHLLSGLNNDEWDELTEENDGRWRYISSDTFDVNTGNISLILQIDNAYMSGAKIRDMKFRKID